MKNLLKGFTVKDFVVISIGDFLVALGLFFFLMPNSIAAGGVNGLAMVINNYLPFISIGMLMWIMNIILFIVAFLIIGPSFGAKTIYASFLLSGYIVVLEKIYPVFKPITGDVMLEMIIGIIIQGIGMAIIFNANASTGGTDIIAKILNKFFSFDIGKSLLITDVVVTLFAGITFGIAKGLYALVTVTMNGLLIDKAIESFNALKEVKIISSENEKIKEFIMNELERGTTVYHGEGGFTQKPMEILSTVVSKRQFITLKNYIKTIDKNAFIKVYDVYETFGEGFKNIVG
ncbi:YitT family protein [Oceanirhabdus sp. W0125-5]|uniref:YitT family protein n=1 Tax=Oceanirhabdus sp. W0125-5 TaxID=2999116 RepID=UPI0022F304BC|nr:YitT family protein [Oceanirhabdus sp. W0125-5]WBW96999.1 YitT family protein [Oceanirhabdus sp. W0125-5]